MTALEFVEEVAFSGIDTCWKRDTCEQLVKQAKKIRSQPPNFDHMSWFSLVFLLERTDFKEPSFCGFGFATRIQEELIQSAKKKVGDDPIKQSLLDSILNGK